MDNELGLEVTVLVRDMDIDDIMVTALEGGICYWCDEAKVVGQYLGKYASEQISNGGELLLHLIEEPDDYGEWRTLNRKKFMKGLKMTLDELGSALLSPCGYKFELALGRIDAEVADVIIQYAVFDEIVFG